MNMHMRHIPLLLVAGLLYTVFAWTPPAALGQCGELIVNGNFQAGNTGFTSEYTYTNDLWPASTYTVTTNPNNQHPHFVGRDHTSGAGYYLVVNGSTTGGKYCWRQTVNVVPNSRYIFSAWLSSVVTSEPAQLMFRVNGVPLGSPLVAPGSLYTWVFFDEEWQSGAATTAVIDIIDLSTVSSGNDFGLDDISFKKIGEAPVITLADYASMWPPNHNYVNFPLAQIATVTDDCDPAPQMYITAVDSDEPEDALGGGDGNTINDIVIASDCKSVQLRAERKGGGNGRVYAVHLRATDSRGHVTTAVWKAEVRHNVGLAAINDGAAAGYTEYGCTPNAPKRGAQALPTGLTLEQNYPNPFNPVTRISYNLPEDGLLTLRIFDASGSEVATLVNEFRGAGTYRTDFDAANYPSGMYFYRLEACGSILQRTMQRVK